MKRPDECDPLQACRLRTDGHWTLVHDYWDEVIEEIVKGGTE